MSSEKRKQILKVLQDRGDVLSIILSSRGAILDDILGDVALEDTEDVQFVERELYRVLKQLIGCKVEVNVLFAFKRLLHDSINVLLRHLDAKDGNPFLALGALFDLGKDIHRQNAESEVNVASLFDHFMHLDGLEKCKSYFESLPPNEKLCSFLDMCCQVSSLLTKEQKSTVEPWIHACVFAYFSSLVEKDPKSVSQEMLYRISDLLQENLTALIDDKSARKAVETFQLEISYQLFKCQYLEKRIMGISEISDLIYRIEAKEEYMKKQSTAISKISAIVVPNEEAAKYANVWMSSGFIVTWLVEHKFIEECLASEKTHIELVRRIFPILRLFAKHQSLYQHHLDLLWSLAITGHHESVEFMIYEIAASLSQLLRPQGLFHLFSLIKTKPFSDYDSKFIDLLEKFSLQAFIVLERAKSFNPSEPANQFAVPLLWESMTHPSSPKDIQFRSRNAFFSLLQSPFVEHLSSFYMRLCSKAIQTHDTTIDFYVIIQKLLEGNTKPGFFGSSSSSLCRSIVSLQEETNVLDQVLLDMFVLRDEVGSAGLMKRLSFLTFLLKHSSLRLGVGNIAQLWSALLEESANEDHHALLYDFLEFAVDFPSEDFYEKSVFSFCLEKLFSLDPASLMVSLKAISCAKKYFLHVHSVQKKSLVFEKERKLYQIYDFAAIESGVAFFWKVAIYSPSDDVAKESTQFFNSMFVLDRSKGDEFQSFHLNKCLSLLNKVASRNDPKMVKRSISILENFIQQSQAPDNAVHLMFDVDQEMSSQILNISMPLDVYIGDMRRIVFESLKMPHFSVNDIDLYWVAGKKQLNANLIKLRHIGIKNKDHISVRKRKESFERFSSNEEIPFPVSPLKGLLQRLSEKNSAQKLTMPSAGYIGLTSLIRVDSLSEYIWNILKMISIDDGYLKKFKEACLRGEFFPNILLQSFEMTFCLFMLDVAVHSDRIFSDRFVACKGIESLIDILMGLLRSDHNLKEVSVGLEYALNAFHCLLEKHVEEYCSESVKSLFQISFESLPIETIFSEMLSVLYHLSEYEIDERPSYSSMLFRVCTGLCASSEQFESEFLSDPLANAVFTFSCLSMETEDNIQNCVSFLSYARNAHVTRNSQNAVHWMLELFSQIMHSDISVLNCECEPYFLLLCELCYVFPSFTVSVIEACKFSMKASIPVQIGVLRLCACMLEVGSFKIEDCVLQVDFVSQNYLNPSTDPAFSTLLPAALCVLHSITLQHSELRELCLEKLSQSSLWKKTTLLWDYNPFLHIREKDMIGLKNHGATCYLNSILQMLYNVPAFVFSVSGCDSASPTLLEMRKVFAFLHSSAKTWHDPIDFCSQSGLGDISLTEQKDVNEFLNQLLDLLENDMKPHLLEIFGGTLLNRVVSEECEHSSEKIEPFYVLSISVKNKVSLEESLDLFVQGDRLSGDNKWYCSDCKAKVTATKQIALKELPRYLIVHLSRFEFDYDSMQKTKLHDRFEFPIETSFEKYTQEDSNGEMYSLCGIIVHSGTSESGHYYAYLKKDEEWFEFNDTLVRKFDASRIPEMCFGDGAKLFSAYLLLYERVGLIKPKILSHQFNDIVRESNLEFLCEQVLFDYGFQTNLKSLLSADSVIDSPASLDLHLKYISVVIIHSQYYKVFSHWMHSLQELVKLPSMAQLFLKRIEDDFQWFKGLTLAPHKNVGLAFVDTFLLAWSRIDPSHYHRMITILLTDLSAAEQCPWIFLILKGIGQSDLGIHALVDNDAFSKIDHYLRLAETLPHPFAVDVLLLLYAKTHSNAVLDDTWFNSTGILQKVLSHPLHYKKGMELIASVAIKEECSFDLTVKFVIEGISIEIGRNYKFLAYFRTIDALLQTGGHIQLKCITKVFPKVLHFLSSILDGVLKDNQFTLMSIKYFAQWILKYPNVSRWADQHIAWPVLLRKMKARG